MLLALLLAVGAVRAIVVQLEVLVLTAPGGLAAEMAAVRGRWR
jgi:hypothetical protein